MPEDTFLQNIALEMNLSETAFLQKTGETYHLRWFSPLREVEFCGHATLASAHTLWETGLEHKTRTLEFDTLRGKLYARYVNNKIELDFPAGQVKEIPPQPKLNKALGIKPLFTGDTGKGYLFEIENLETLRSLQPDFNTLKKLGDRKFIVTCKSSDSEFDFYSRFFAPSVGIDEDPVTGSAHTYLAPYWSRKLGKNVLQAFQASQRGGKLECEAADNGRILIRGQAVTVFEIDLREEHIPHWH
ncbi:MAG: PhzF family phenazine biosynthesis isomerase [Dehalococcoidales bacterium]|nr:PhzF family phenazine biosynthesis isomerase [Dehalococcoidales bacterium]